MAHERMYTESELINFACQTRHMTMTSILDMVDQTIEEVVVNAKTPDENGKTVDDTVLEISRLSLVSIRELFAKCVVPVDEMKKDLKKLIDQAHNEAKKH